MVQDKQFCVRKEELRGPKYQKKTSILPSEIVRVHGLYGFDDFIADAMIKKILPL